mgnify:CR=1 FL=1
MSEVILDTITGKSTATTITIGSTPVVSASANSMTIRGEGSNQTSIQQGLCKNWVHFDASPSTLTVEESFNTSSVTDDGTGYHRVNFSTSFGNVNYTQIGCTAGDGGDDGDHSFVPYNDQSGGTTSQSMQLRPSDHSGNRRDCKSVYHMSNGDLA